MSTVASTSGAQAIVGSHISRVPAGMKTGRHNMRENSPLYQACLDFEAIFLEQMLKAMRKTVNKSGFLSGGFAEEVYEDMLYTEYAKSMAKSAEFGLASKLYNQLSSFID